VPSSILTRVDMIFNWCIKCAFDIGGGVEDPQGAVSPVQRYSWMPSGNVTRPSRGQKYKGFSNHGQSMSTHLKEYDNVA